MALSKILTPDSVLMDLVKEKCAADRVDSRDIPLLAFSCRTDYDITSATVRATLTWYFLPGKRKQLSISIDEAAVYKVPATDPQNQALQTEHALRTLFRESLSMALSDSVRNAPSGPRLNFRAELYCYKLGKLFGEHISTVEIIESQGTEKVVVIFKNGHRAETEEKSVLSEEFIAHCCMVYDI
jgi:hypothetical protein